MGGNTAVQASGECVAWKICNTNDKVVAGAVVSECPRKEGIESMIGLFINTIPVRVTYDETENFKFFSKTFVS